MKNINKVMLIGYLGNNPKINKINRENYVLNFPLSTSEKYNNNSSITWHNISLFTKNKKINNILKKGMLVFLEGRIKYSFWGKDNKNTRVNIVCNIINILSAVKKNIKIFPY